MENIKTILNKIEEERKIRILYACETGSRAWGFPSPDSDYDIRLLYVHEKNWYLSLSPKKDSIEYMNGDLDITGWDIRKALGLLKKSNAPLIERFRSPIEYYSVPGFKEEFLSLINNYYSPTAVFFHHYSLAVKFWQDIKDVPSFKLKSWFYLIRSLLSCNWIIQDKSVAPMNIVDLMKYLDTDTQAELKAMIVLKSALGEKYVHPANEKWNHWIIIMFQKLEFSKEDLGVNRMDNSILNEFFLKILDGKTYN